MLLPTELTCRSPFYQKDMQSLRCIGLNTGKYLSPRQERSYLPFASSHLIFTLLWTGTARCRTPVRSAGDQPYLIRFHVSCLLTFLLFMSKLMAQTRPTQVRRVVEPSLSYFWSQLTNICLFQHWPSGLANNEPNKHRGDWLRTAKPNWMRLISLGS